MPRIAVAIHLVDEAESGVPAIHHIPPLYQRKYKVNAINSRPPRVIEIPESASLRSSQAIRFFFSYWRYIQVLKFCGWPSSWWLVLQGDFPERFWRVCLNKWGPLQLRGSGPSGPLGWLAVLWHTQSPHLLTLLTIKRAPSAPSLPGHNQHIIS